MFEQLNQIAIVIILLIITIEFMILMINLLQTHTEIRNGRVEEGESTNNETEEKNNS